DRVDVVLGEQVVRPVLPGAGELGTGCAVQAGQVGVGIGQGDHVVPAGPARQLVDQLAPGDLVAGVPGRRRRSLRCARPPLVGGRLGGVGGGRGGRVGGGGLVVGVVTGLVAGPLA